MLVTKPFIPKSFRVPVSLLQIRNTVYGKMLLLTTGILLSLTGITNAQTTCATAVSITPVNASSCTPGTGFNVSSVGTGTAFTSCGTGVSGPLNAWGKFVANSSTASISYTPPNNRDAMIFAYSGACPNPAQIDCVDDWGNGTTETLNLTGLTAGTTYFFRIVAYNRNSGNMNGSVCVASPYVLTTGTISGSPLCAGSSVAVPFTSSGIFSSNTYTAQLSNASGSFASPVAIGTVSSNANAGSVSATIPAATAYGTSYRIRVVSNGPAVTGTDNGTNITINSPQGVFSGNTICGTGTGQLSFTASSGTGPFSITYNDGALNHTQPGMASGASFTPAIPPVVTSNYTLQSVTDANGCTRSSGFTGGSATITFSSVPTISASSTAAAKCYSGSAQNSTITYSLTTGSPTQYAVTWDAGALAAGLVNLSNTAITSSPLNIPVAAGVAAGTYNGSITVTNGAGCTSSGSAFTITINPLPAVTGTLGACTGGTTQLTGSPTAAASSPWASATPAVATVNSSGLVTGIAAGSSIITYTNNNGCSNTATVIISNSAPSTTGVTICTGGSGTLSSSTTCPGGSSASTGAVNAGSAVNNTGTGTGAWTNAGNITAPGSPYATQSLAGNAISNYLQSGDYGFSIPSNATINGITVTIRKQSSGNNMADNIVRIVKNGGITGNNLASGTNWSNGSFNVSTYGGAANLWGTTWTAADINAANFGVVISADNNSGNARQIDIDYIQVNVSYTTSGTLNWYTASSGGTLLGTGTPFNPVGVAGSGIANTSTAGATIFYAECGTAPGCRTATNFIILDYPTITTAAKADTICYSSNARNSTLSYSSATGSPTQYAITWDAAALAAGLANLPNTAITASPLNIPVAGNVAGGTYTGSITVTNAGGCTSSSNVFTLTIKPSPTITSSSPLGKCFSNSYQNGVINYSATTNAPGNYSITWDAAAQAAGLNNLTNATISSSPLLFPIPAATAAGTYNGILKVTSSNGCSSDGTALSQLITPLPTISSSATATSMCYSAASQNSSLSYSATTNSPVLYSITWDAAAQSAGLVNIGLTSITASPLNIPVAAGVATGTYNGTLRVMNGAGCLSVPGYAFTLTITSGTIPVMTSTAATAVCSGNTVNIALTSTVASTYTWIATSHANVSGESTTLQTTSTLSNTLAITSGGTQTVNYTVTPTSTGGCPGTPQAVVVTVNTLPTITTAATAASRCYNASAQTSTLGYSATTGSPVTYAITWNAAAISAGMANTGNISLPASPVTFSIPAGVAAGTYTGTLSVTNANGCTSTGNSFTVSITAAPNITSQPSSTTVCSGSPASFSITASGTGLTYQWRKGTTNLCNCGTASGANAATFNISSVVTGDASTNYNCVISSSGCTNVISNYATLTVNTSTPAPTSVPTTLVFPTVSTTSILASFTPSADAAYYLVIRKPTNVAPTNPNNGTTYALNSTTLTGTVDYVGTNTSFTSNGLTPGTTYYYWVFPYNVSSCGTSPLYLTSTPLTGNVTTATNVACGTVTTLYWGGTGSGLSGAVSGTDFNTASNWSTSGSSYVASPAAPTQCNNVSMALTSSATITLSANTSIYSLLYTVAGNSRSGRLSTEGRTLTVNGDAVIDVLSGNQNTSIYIGENGSGAGIVDFKGNFRIGETYHTSGSNDIPQSYLIGNVNSKITFRGDVLFGRSSKFILPNSQNYPPSIPVATPGTGTTPGTIEFDGPGLQQVLWNNNYYYDNFYNIVVGNQNKPYVRHVTGTYTPDNILNNLTINDGCTVDLGASQWIRESSGGTFTMNGTAKLILGNNQSVRSSPGTGIRITGSNFPGGFATMNISSTSTIEYDGNSSITQTVYEAPVYGNLILSNGDNSGTANKISTSTVTVSGTATVSDKTVFTPGAGVVINGTGYVNSGGTLVCGTNTISGSGVFNLQSGGTLSMGSTQGITASGAAGNIQTTAGRNFSTSANYIYNGSAAQATGNGLPTTVNNLTISNTTGVTMHAASANYTVTNILNLVSGALAINGDSLTINNLQRTSGTLTGSAASSVGINGTNIPLFFTSSSRVLKNLFVNTNASADLQAALDITAGSSAGSVAVASGATLNTYGYLTLKSDANGTARIAQIPVDGSGNALGNINGDVTVERFIPAKRSWRMVTAPVQAAGSQTINDAWQENVVNTDLANNQNPNPGFGIHISGSSPSLGFDATPNNTPSMRVFTRSTTTWDPIANTLNTYVRDYEGYLVFVRGSRSTNLSQNTSAALSNTVIRETGGMRMGRQLVNLAGGPGNYSVVGNPYASTIDFRNLSISGSGSTSSFIMWDPALTGAYGVGAYQYFTQVSGPGSNYTVFPGGGSYGASGSVNNFVQSGQAFLVQNSGAATLTINESAKTSTSTSTVFRPMPDNVTGRISTILYKVEADSSTTVVDGGLVLYRNEYSNELDLEDVKKMKNTNSENFGINKGSGIYQIEKKQFVEEGDTIQYSLRNVNARKYQLVVELTNMEASGMTAFLEDSYTGIVTPLDNYNPYTLTFTPTVGVPGSYAQDRFKIYFKQLAVLPVTFSSLDAYRKQNTVKVDWKVQHETNIDHYEVERSADGIHFKKQSGAIAATNSSAYQWTDEQPQTGLNYFRVKSTGNNGGSKYTNIAKVYFGKQATGITVFPNPVSNGNINLYFTQEQKGNYTVRLFNNNGQLIQTNKLAAAGGNGNATVTLENGIPHGNYILEIIKPDNSKEHISIAY